MKKLREHLEKYEGSRILDVATGQGTFMSMIASVYDGFVEMTGIDISDRAIAAVEKSFSDPRISARKMDVNDMCFEEGYFDLTCLSNSMHHVNDINETIGNMAKVTMDDGLLIFNEMRRDNDSEKKMTHTYLHHFWAEIDRLNGITHEETLTKDQIIDVFEKNEDVDIVEYWELETGAGQEIDETAYEWLKNTIDASLKRAEGKGDYDRLLEEAAGLKKRLKDVGFESASQVMVVLKKR